jgi:hypothetical protein
MAGSFQSRLWKVALPDGWKARGGGERDGEVHTIWHPEGVGTLTVFYHSDLTEPSRSKNDQVYSGSLSGYYNQRRNGSLKRTWRLLCGGQWLWVRYSAALQPEDWEDSGIDAIVGSLSETVQQGD